jgi:hypothetical protein
VRAFRVMRDRWTWSAHSPAKVVSLAQSCHHEVVRASDSVAFFGCGTLSFDGYQVSTKGTR